MKHRRLQPKDYTVGWICALPIELAAAQEMLDEKHEGPPYDSFDANLYTLGCIGRHNVVLSCLSAGQIGPQSAANVATRMKAKFTSIRFGLMVGIGGGVPSSERDIRLGDVVVSQPHLEHGGVVQYDSGKTGPDGRKTRTGWLNAPPAVLLQAVSGLRARHYRDRSNFALYLSIFDRLDNFRRDSAGSDVLFEATYNHVGGKTCEQCNKEKEVKRPPRGGQNVVIHYGTIASGSQVIKDGISRDQISRELGGVLCFEMEAAGLMNDFPCLVIRGICDYADSHKNKKWQSYAAATAAVCAKEILSIIPPADLVRTATVDEIDLSHSTPKTHFLVPLLRNSRFVSVSYLNILEKKLFTERCQRLAIYGLGGVGKTQIVLELAYQTRERNPSYSVFWIQASSVEKVEQAYLQIGHGLQIPGINEEKADVKQLVKQKLSQESAGEWLLILDNADDADMWFKETDTTTWNSSLVDMLPRSTKGSVIWTTRDRKGALKMAPSQDTLNIHEMEESVASDLLRKSLIRPADLQMCARLLYQLTYLPLAIAQAAAYINANQISIAEYLSLLEEAEETTINMLSEDFEDEGRYRDLKNPVATTWLISFRQIRRHNSLAAKYLSFMSCLDANGVPQAVLPRAATRKDATDAIGTLSAYSFITKRSAGPLTTNPLIDNQAFDLHRLVRLATRNWLRAENKLGQWSEKAMTRLVDIFPTAEHMNMPQWTVYLPHALCICFSDAIDKNSTERGRLLEKIGLCLLAEGRYKEAIGPIEEALQARIEVLGNEHPDTLMSINDLGRVLSKQGNYKAAEEMNRRVLEGREKALGKEHPDTLTSVNNLALMLQHQGKYKAAEEMNRRALERREKALGKEHLDTLTSVSNLASVLQHQGKYEAAEEMNRRAL
ncbi:purine and uridine phosphorylase [Cenococcum geophilum]